jgi:hypothetical protein
LSPLHRPLPAVLLAALSFVLLAGCGGSHRHFTVRPTPLISIFEAPAQLTSDPATTLDVLKRLGADDVRVLMRWSTVAPAPTARGVPRNFNAGAPGAYPAGGWAPYDAIVRDAAARHMGVLLDVSGPAPAWAAGRGAPPGGVPGVWKPSPPRFALFVRAAGLRYSGHYKPPGAASALPRVSFWSVWNEPNLGEANLAPQVEPKSSIESAPRMYRALLDGAWTSLRATGHARDTILIGELAPYGQSFGRFAPGNFGYMVPMRFVRALYCVNGALHPLQGRAAALRGCPTTAAGSKRFAGEHPALFSASGFAVHPYPSGRAAPNLVLPDESDFVYLATLGRLEGFLDKVTPLYGAGRQFPLYSTEYGYITNPPYPPGAPVNVAAGYLNWAEYLTWRDRRLRSWDQYLLVDPPSGGPSNFDTGLEYNNGAPKPLFAAYRLPIFLPVTRERRGHGLEVWGCLRPAHYLHRPQTVRIELQAGGRGAFKQVAGFPVTDPNGYFDTVVRFPSGGRVRLAWSYPGGEKIHSRLVTVTAGG